MFPGDSCLDLTYLATLVDIMPANILNLVSFTVKVGNRTQDKLQWEIPPKSQNTKSLGLLTGSKLSQE